MAAVCQRASAPWPSCRWPAAERRACQRSVRGQQCAGGRMSATTGIVGGMTYSIVAEGLVKRFGETVALAGVDLEVRTGSVFGLLGPNGAGKTTAVRILATLVRPDAGHATVGGYDVVASAHQVRQLIGLTGQYAAVDGTLTGLEDPLLIGRLVGQSRSAARHRARELLSEFRLPGAAAR